MTAEILAQLKVKPDFSSDGPVRYAHRTLDGSDLYFVSNRSGEKITANCLFRVASGTPEIWNPLTGETRQLNEFTNNGEITAIPIQFESHQSFFILFDTKNNSSEKTKSTSAKNFPAKKNLMTLEGSWKLTFDPKMGGPAEILFNKLEAWNQRTEDGIKYYSGTVGYHKIFTLSKEMLSTKAPLLLCLGEVYNLAEVSLNGISLGTLWTAPWSVDITKAVKTGENTLDIRVVNLWPNRLIGDEKYPSDGISNHAWPDWMLKNQPRTSQRFTFATYSFYKKDASLLKSGLLGPVSIVQEEQ